MRIMLMNTICVQQGAETVTQKHLVVGSAVCTAQAAGHQMLAPPDVPRH